jgi:aspartate racemase
MTKLAVIGGMGPLASAAFLQTIYERRCVEREQEQPDVVLYSLASMPDRTSTILGGQEDLLLDRLVAALDRVELFAPTAIVLCCVTSHRLLPRLPAESRRKIRSLTDTALRSLVARGERAILLASKATYESRIFEESHHYAEAAPFIVMPAPDDRERVYGMIYDDLKKGRRVRETSAAIAAMMVRYKVGAFMAGCTEFHLVTRHLREQGIAAPRFVDPLMTIADEMAGAGNRPVIA